ncbi:MAG: FmdB family zinc ribbon protein [Planctomycetaceae bacterium]
MPLFEFRCGECDREFELLVRAGDVPQCPTCGRERVEKLLSATAAPAAQGRSRLPIAADCPPGDAPCGPGCCRLP